MQAIQHLLDCAMKCSDASIASHYVETLRRRALESSITIPEKLTRLWCSNCSYLFTNDNHTVRTKTNPRKDLYVNCVVYSCKLCAHQTTIPGILRTQRKIFDASSKQSLKPITKPTPKHSKKNALQALLLKNKKPKQSLSLTDFLTDL